MKKIITLSAFMFGCFFTLLAQQTDNIDIIPSPSSPTDAIQAVITTSYPGGPCNKESQTVTQSNDTIVISGFYCYQSASGGCSTTDTFTIGTLAAGDYVVRFMLFTSNTSAPCGSAGYFLKAITLESFTVGNQTGITSPAQNNLSVSPNAAAGVIYITLNQSSDVEFKLYDLSGKVVNSLLLPQQQAGLVQAEFNPSELNQEVYIYSVKTSEGVASGKFFVAK